jgi:hypothetical protein
MNRAAFLKRMAFAAMACAFFDVPVPKLVTREPDLRIFGDGFHDDAPGIQALIDASRGGHVTLRPGDYALGTTVHVPSDVELTWRDSA